MQGHLAPGTYELTIVASNAGGASPASLPLRLTIVAPPATPSAPTLLPTDSDGSPGGETTYLTSPFLTGTTMPGATVQLLSTSGAVLNTTRADNTGSYEVQIPGPLGVGSDSYEVAAIDQYGDLRASGKNEWFGTGRAAW